MNQEEKAQKEYEKLIKEYIEEVDERYKELEEKGIVFYGLDGENYCKDIDDLYKDKIRELQKKYLGKALF